MQPIATNEPKAPRMINADMLIITIVVVDKPGPECFSETEKLVYINNY